MNNLNIENKNLAIKSTKAIDNRVYKIAKRTIDIIGASLGLILLSPVFLIIAIAVKFESKGPAVFSHTRKGMYRRDIKIYKFRTMYNNSKEIFQNFTEEQKAEYYENFKLDNDPRVTKVGNFLRRTSLDELPQLLNILKGELSIVGPRPIVEAEIEKYGDKAEKFFSVIPGLTGYWQANGRSDTTYAERVEMDMHYIDNRSIKMDLMVIIKTVISVVKKKGAI